MRATHLLLVGLAAVGLVVVACVSTGASVRSTTYAPSFHYIEREKLTSAMWRMADDVAALDGVLRGAAPEDVPQAEVVRLLDDLHGAAAGLGGGASNHPLLNAHLADFLREVEAARAAAAATPPAYFLAGSVTGACIHCHGARDARR